MILRLSKLMLLGAVWLVALAAAADAQICVLKVGAWEGEAESLPSGGKTTTRKATVADFSSTAVNQLTKKTYRGVYRSGTEYFPIYFEGIPEGPYKVTIKKSGFNTTVQEYRVRCICAPDRAVFLDVLVSRGNPTKVIFEKEAGRFGGFGSAKDLVKGKLIDSPKAEYPAAAVAANITGIVTVKVSVDEDGVVISATALSGHPILAEAAETAAHKAKFSVSCLNGKPTKANFVISYSFGKE